MARSKRANRRSGSEKGQSSREAGWRRLDGLRRPWWWSRWNGLPVGGSGTADDFLSDIRSVSNKAGFGKTRLDNEFETNKLFLLVFLASDQYDQVETLHVQFAGWIEWGHWGYVEDCQPK